MKIKKTKQYGTFSPNLDKERILESEEVIIFGLLKEVILSKIHIIFKVNNFVSISRKGIPSLEFGILKVAMEFLNGISILEK